VQINNHSELVFNVLRYATRALEEGDESLLLLMGFLPEEIRAIEKLSLKRLKNLSELGTHFMDFHIDHASLRRMIANLERDMGVDQLRDDLLRWGAPSAMMAHYWGMTTTDCAVRRRVLEINTPPGRPPKLSDATLEELWRLWHETKDIEHEGERYLRLAEETRSSLAMIWPVVEEWKMLAQPSAPVLSGGGASPGGRARRRERGSGTRGDHQRRSASERSHASQPAPPR